MVVFDYKKRGHMCVKQHAPKKYAIIHIDGDFAFIPEHNFVYDVSKEEDKLYMALPCVFTDKRFYSEDLFHNSSTTDLYYSSDDKPKHYKNAWCKINRKPKKKGKKLRSLESCIRLVQKIKGMPKGLEVLFENHWNYKHRRSIPSYMYVHNGNNSNYTPDYKIDNECYFDNFKTDIWAKELVEKLRNNGFIVDYNEEYQFAKAYGFDKMIGISSEINPIYYFKSNVILYDYRNCFDKWSKCLEISKSTPIDEIVNKLVNETKEEAYKK